MQADLIKAKHRWRSYELALLKRNAVGVTMYSSVSHTSDVTHDLTDVTGQWLNRLFVAYELLDMLIPGADRLEREGVHTTPGALTC